MKYEETFRREVREFLDRTGMAWATFGRLALKDPAFVGRLLGPEKLDPKLSTADKVSRWMERRAGGT